MNRRVLHPVIQRIPTMLPDPVNNGLSDQFVNVDFAFLERSAANTCCGPPIAIENRQEWLSQRSLWLAKATFLIPPAAFRRDFRLTAPQALDRIQRVNPGLGQQRIGIAAPRQPRK